MGLFWNKKPKKVLRQVIVHHFHMGSHPTRFETVIDILKGQYFRKATWDKNCAILDAEGTVLREWDWQAGFTHDYEYIYSD